MTVASMISRHGVVVTIQRKSADTLDSSGGRVESWSTDIETLYGLVQVRGNSDAVAGGSERSTRQATIYFDGKPSIAVSDRIAYGTITYEVRSVRVPDERPLSDALCYTIVEAEEVFG